MERPTQSSLVCQVGGFCPQSAQGRESILDDLTCFLQEDVTQFSIIICIRINGRWCHGCSLRNHRHLSGLRRHSQLQCRQIILYGNVRDCWGLFVRLHLSTFTAHERTEFASFLVIDKQRFGKRTLVAQHVDQEAHSPQTVADLFKNSGACTGLVDVIHKELLHAGTHTQGRNRGLIQTQHRKHTAHLCQLTWHLAQRRLVLRVAEELVQRLFHLAQSGAQLIHHAAHGLAVTHTAVQLLHPRFQRLRLAT